MANATPKSKKIKVSEKTEIAPQGEAAKPPKILSPKIAIKKSKPTLEGINIPAVIAPPPSQPAAPSAFPPPAIAKPELTEAEKKLIRETQEYAAEFAANKPAIPGSWLPKPAPPQLPKITLPAKKPKRVGLILFLVLICILVVGGWKLYSIYQTRTANDDKNSAKESLNSNSQQAEPENTASSDPTNNNLATSTNPANATSTPSATAPTTTALTQLQILPTPTDFLNVRQGPSLAAKIITRVHPGETYPYAGTQNNWYNITLPDGTIGWVSGQYIKQLP